MSDVATALRLADLAAADRLAEANLLMARFVRPDVDEGKVMDRIAQLASQVRGDTHLALRRVISIAEGIGGNVDDYYDIDNHFLDTVLATRRGVPISLSVLWIEVGRRVGIEMEGVGMPGHFLVYAGGQLVDPFHYGEAIGFDEAASLVAEALGGEPRADRSWFQPVGSVLIVRRMLLNLEQIYRERAESHNLEWVASCLEALPV
ncbi:MAG TPA: transglutaminase-like domain-containing protein [Acidimicrobiia bacterium]|nr:transglutaminase-like domain-containing protein [Acidimicrobiia bacterium]